MELSQEHADIYFTWVWCLELEIHEEEPLYLQRAVLIGCSWNLHAGWKHKCP